MRIPSMDTIYASADRLFCRLFRGGEKGELRTTPPEGVIKINSPEWRQAARLEATRTTNLIVRELRRGRALAKSSIVPIEGNREFARRLATQTTNLILRDLR